MKSDFKFQYNDSGDWCDALVSTPKDQNSASLWYVTADGQWHLASDAQRGDGPGHFRDKE